MMGMPNQMGGPMMNGMGGSIYVTFDLLRCGLYLF